MKLELEIKPNIRYELKYHVTKTSSNIVYSDVSIALRPFRYVLTGMFHHERCIRPGAVSDWQQARNYHALVLVGSSSNVDNIMDIRLFSAPVTSDVYR